MGCGKIGLKTAIMTLVLGTAAAAAQGAPLEARWAACSIGGSGTARSSSAKAPR